MNATYIRAAITALLVTIWPPALVWAGSVTLDKTLAGLSPTVVAVVMVLSTLAGVTALLRRIRAELLASAGHNLPLPWLFAAAHMTGSWLAGLVFFGLCEAGDLNDWLELVVVILASYGGAHAVELAAEKYLPGVMKAPGLPEVKP